MVNVRLLADLPKALDSAAAGTILNKDAGGLGFDSASYDDLGATGSIDSAAVLAIANSSYLSLRINTGGFNAKNHLDSGVGNSLVPDSSGRTVRIGNYSKPINNLYLDSASTVYIGSNHSFSLSSSFIEFNGGNSASTFGASASVVDAGIAWGGDRGIFFEGKDTNNNPVNTTDYIDITTPGNASDFGDMIGTASLISGTASNGTRAVLHSGYIASGTGWNNGIRYVTVATTSSAASFGFVWYQRYGGPGASDGTYGVFSGGLMNLNGGTNTDNIEYITIDTTGNGSNFGTLAQAKRVSAGANDATYAVNAGGYTTTYTNDIQYFTIATTGNASDFGDMTQSKMESKGLSNETYGVFAGGNTGSASNVIEYITVATPANATDFGDLTVNRRTSAGNGSSNGTYGLFDGGSTNGSNFLNSIDYITIDTPGNATDFGDMTISAHNRAGSSGSPS